MSAAVAGAPQEADIAGSIRHESANSNTSRAPEQAKRKRKSSVDSQGKNPSTDRPPAKKIDAKDVPISINKAREDFEKQKQGINLPPYDICQQYQRVFPLVRNWWVKNPEDSHYREMDRINNDIRAANRLAGRDQEMFLFPYEMICNNVISARMILKNVQSKKGHERTNEAMKMLRGHIDFSKIMLELNIDYKHLIHQEVLKELNEIFSMPELEKERTELNNLFRKPTIRQLTILEPALELLSKFYDFLDQKDNHSMDRIISELNEINNRLVESNLEEGLKENDHILPIDYLQAINNVFSGENLDMTPEKRDEIIKISSKRIEAILQFFGVSDAPIPKKYTEGVELPEEELRQMRQDFANFEGIKPQESTESGKPQQQEKRGEQHHGQQNAGDSSPKLMSLPQTKPLVNEGISEGITDCGKVLSVMKVGFGHRVFTNIGTDIVPVYKMFPGSCFPKSVREDLYTNFASKPQPHEMKDSQIEILDTIKHPVKNGNYTWIVYKWTAEQDPKPRIMSLTELARRLGKKPAVSQVNNGLKARDQRLEILRLMRESPDNTIAEGVPSFNECPPYMADGLID